MFDASDARLGTDGGLLGNWGGLLGRVLAAVLANLLCNAHAERDRGSCRKRQSGVPPCFVLMS